MKPFDIVFYKGESLVGKLIRFISKSERYSHCAFLLDSGLHCLELSWKNPTEIFHFKYKSSEYEVYRLNNELTEFEKEELIRYIYKYLNSGYDFKYLITRGLNMLIGTKIINDKNKMTCDEMIVDSFRHIGINLVSDDTLITPEVLAKSNLLIKIK